jgi:D-sedoheptulose 7-phosphate isomerase
MRRDEFTSRARAYLEDSAGTISLVRTDHLDAIVDAAELIVRAVRDGRKILICGNGGSAADAQHLATEFVSTLTTDHPRPSIAAIALTTDTSLLTAIANDYGVDGMFARQVEALAKAGDVLIAISTSGDSANVVQAADEARSRGASVVALTGATGGKLAGLADVALKVPSTVTAHIQEAHLAIEQLLALLVEREIYP